jgi:hypothetical protein
LLVAFFWIFVQFYLNVCRFDMSSSQMSYTKRDMIRPDLLFQHYAQTFITSWHQISVQLD